MDELKKIIAKILLEIEAKERIVNVKGGKGMGTGTAYPEGTVGALKLLGKEEQEMPEEYEFKPVEISKAFKKDDQ